MCRLLQTLKRIVLKYFKRRFINNFSKQMLINIQKKKMLKPIPDCQKKKKNCVFDTIFRFKRCNILYYTCRNDACTCYTNTRTLFTVGNKCLYRCIINN